MLKMNVPVLDNNFAHPGWLRKKRYGVHVITVQKLMGPTGLFSGRIITAGGEEIAVRWNLLEEPCTQFAVFREKVTVQKFTLYMCLRRQQHLPKDVIKMILTEYANQQVYRGPFYGTHTEPYVVEKVMEYEHKYGCVKKTINCIRTTLTYTDADMANAYIENPLKFWLAFLTLFTVVILPLMYSINKSNFQ